MSLTKKQKEVLDYIEAFMAAKGYSPSIEEIAGHFGFSSPNAVFKHLKALERRGYIRRHSHAARSIEILKPDSPAAGTLVELPLLGYIAAGAPIEALENAESIQVPPDLTARGTHYVLRVKGDSMIGEHIEDGDFVIVRETAQADNGDMVVALVDGENATLKRLYRENGTIRLQPANPTMEPLYLPAKRVRIRGVVVGVMRKYR
ncbi:MAG: transcriptional repressor LexA [Acidobacteria bacterium]|nr:transcriptional repressor LexA [Acidobacteriota bacterium]